MGGFWFFFGGGDGMVEILGFVDVCGLYVCIYICIYVCKNVCICIKHIEI